MNSIPTMQSFGVMVEEACREDNDLRHEIERTKVFDAYPFALEVAYDLFSRHFLSLRESFGLTERT
ncbi:MAG: hypothetical protein A2286_12380 [Gammaproteobacteria bacterium RIFOXYA12_FULL_61_12]|nr:MAG: hypothetical protein A2514_11955 [Gammaproteobacteria bacterium RIFOXYD12_FULL_61_37]OGT93828.1 MAG: hypothetical protein A2286_12380 [Gammaproteobacteria bacterium RIFOXYA12_FULL_61_12]